MKCKTFILGLLTMLILQSCDCWILVKGNIVDSRTEKPIAGVNIEFLNVDSEDFSKSSDSIRVNRVFKTDSLGRFTMTSNNYGMCPDLEPKIKIWKEGYISKEFLVKENALRNELNEITIKLDKK